MRMWDLLREAGYAGSYDAVRRYAQQWRRAQGQGGTVYVPLTFEPGEAYQFDWSHEIVVLAGVTTTVKVAHMRLCHSRMPFVRAYPRETQEMVFDAHTRAFAFFRGACGRGIYDNMQTAVDTVFVGKVRQFNRRFAQMCSHYLVEPVAWTPGAGWEKGKSRTRSGRSASGGSRRGYGSPATPSSMRGSSTSAWPLPAGEVRPVTIRGTTCRC